MIRADKGRARVSRGRHYRSFRFAWLFGVSPIDVKLGVRMIAKNRGIPHPIIGAMADGRLFLQREQIRRPMDRSHFRAACLPTDRGSLSVLPC